MAVVGSAYVTIRAITTGLRDDINRGLRDSVGDTSRFGKEGGDNFGASFGDSASDTIKRDTDRTFHSIESDAGSSGARAGGLFGGGFNKGANRSLGGSSSRISRLVLQIAALIPVIAAVVGALSSLISGLFALSAAVAPAVNSLIVLPSLLTALVQGFGAAALAFGGVSDAVSAGVKAQTGAASSAASNASAQVAAANRIKDAERALAQVQRDNADRLEEADKRIIDSKRNLRTVYRDARDGIVAGLEDIADAERDVADAQRDAVDAQNAIADARREAREGLIDLGFNVEQAAIDEQEAILRLEDTRAALAEASSLPPDNRTRIDAELAYQQADLNYRRLIESNEDLQQVAEQAAEAGVKGSKEVVDARNDAISAEEAYLQSIEDLQDARKDQRRLELQNARDIRDAEEQLTEAIKDRNDVVRDNARALRDAQRTLKEAFAAANDAAVGASGGVDRFAQAMSNLSPEAQAFVKYLISIRGEFQKLRAAAGEELFPKLQSALEPIVKTLFPQLRDILRETGSALGDVAIEMSGLLTSGPFSDDLARVANTNNQSLRDVGSAVTSLTEAFFSLLAAAKPLVNRFTEWIATYAEFINKTVEAKQQTGELRKSLNDSGDVAAQIGRIFSLFGEGVFELGQVARDSGQKLLDAFEGANQRFADLTDNKDKVEELRKAFNGIQKNVRAIGDLFVDLGGSLFRLGDNPGIRKTSEALREDLLPVLEDIFEGSIDQLGPKISDLLTAVAEAFEQISQSKGFETFLDVLTSFFELLTDFLKSGVGKQLIGVLAPIGGALFAISIIKKFPGLSTLFKLLKRLGGLSLPTLFAGGGGGLASQIDDAALAVDGMRDSIANEIPFDKDKATKLTSLGDEAAGAAGALGGAAGAADGMGDAARVASSHIDEAVVVTAGLGDVTSDVTKKSGGLGAALKGAGSKAKSAGKGFLGAIGGLVGFGPIAGGVILAVGAIVGGFIALYKNSDDFREFIDGTVVPALKRFGSFIQDVALKALQAIGTYIVEKVVPALVKFFVPIVEELQKVWEDLTKAFEENRPALEDLGDQILAVGDFILEKILPALGKFYEFMIPIWGFILRNLIPIIVKLVQFQFALYSAIIKVIGAIVRFGIAVGSAIVKAIAFAIDVVGTLIDFFAHLPGNLVKVAGLAFEWIRERFVEVRDWLVEKVRDVIKFFKELPSKLRAVTGAVFQWIQDRWDQARKWIADKVVDLIRFFRELPGKLRDAASNVFDWIRDKATAAKDFVVEKFQAIVQFFRELPGRIRDVAGDVFDWLRDRAVSAKDFAIEKFQQLVTFIKSLPDKIANVGGAIWESFKSGATTALNSIIDLLNKLITGLNKVISGFNKIPGPDIPEIAAIPNLATGGVIAATPGGVIARLAEAGRSEQVTPLAANGLTKGENAILASLERLMNGSGITMNVYPSEGMDERELAHHASREIAWSIGSA